MPRSDRDAECQPGLVWPYVVLRWQEQAPVLVLWVAHDDNSIELREVETGLINGDLVEVRANLMAREKIITRGSLFIDRAATSGS